MKMSELREKDTGSLQIMERELTENLFAARLQKRSGQLENTAKIANTKRELAQVKTVLRARELGLEVIETAAPATEKKAKTGTHDGKTEAAKAAPKKPETKKVAKGKAKAAPAKKTKTKSAAKAVAKPAKKKAGGKK